MNRVWLGGWSIAERLQKLRYRGTPRSGLVGILLVALERQKIQALLIISSFCWPLAWAAPEGHLELKPRRCVTLHEGQVCYQTFAVAWRADAAADYCLYQSGQADAIQCWMGASSGEGAYHLSAQASVVLYLARRDDKSPIAQARAEVAWVYRKSFRRKSHWRVF